MEGVVKFNCHWNQSGVVITDEQYEILNYWREVLFNMDLIGAYENGVGFGNLSMRTGKTNQFVITGSATGDIPELEPGHYIKVNSFNIDDNAVMCTGPLKASSESLSHAAIYTADQGTNAVVHVHEYDLWRELKGELPTTGEEMEYGTTGLAKEILRLFRETDVMEKRIIIMGGDKAGILTFGHDMDEAVGVLMQYLKK
ncbi:MAG: class II aldolase/adducin family protein [Bacteroidetes bacterium]|nr:class II aldolase/adducin family protein [Bacteroidota bacterium]